MLFLLEMVHGMLDARLLVDLVDAASFIHDVVTRDIFLSGWTFI